MQDEDRAAWWAVWGMACCPTCGRLVTIRYALDAPYVPYFSTHPLHPFDPDPKPNCPQSGHPHESIASFGVLPAATCV